MPSVVVPPPVIPPYSSPFATMDEKARLAFERDRQLALKKADIQKARAAPKRPLKTELNKITNTARTTARHEIKRDAVLDEKDSPFLDMHDIADVVEAIAPEKPFAFVEVQDFDLEDFIIETPITCKADIPPPSLALLGPSLGFVGADSWFVSEDRNGCCLLTTPPPTYSTVTILKAEW
jgi:hypothetical protein